MAKALTLLGVGVSALIFLLFTTDVAVGYPFGKASLVMDVGFMICAVIFGFLSWQTFREQT